MRVLAAVSAVLAFAAASLGQRRTVTDEEVARVHRSALLIDTHNDVTWNVYEGFDFGRRTNQLHTDLPRLKEGGFGAVFFSAYVDADYVAKNSSANRALQLIDTIRHDIAGRYPSDFLLAASVADIERARREGKIAALIGIEGGHAIEDSLRLLRAYYDLGVRYMTLTHSNTNNWADSSGDINRPGVRHHNGLTDFGRQVVREMNRLGMMVDISHVSDKTFFDALETSTAPIIASHSSARAVMNHPRNMTDDMIMALARKGGVVQVNFNCGFVSPRFAAAQQTENPKLEERFRQETGGKLSEPAGYIVYDRLRKEMGLTRATLAELADHIDHIRRIAGVEAVGIGSDFNGVTCVPEGLEDVSKMPNLTRELLERGYSAEDIRKIYGGNLLRVMRAVEAERDRLRRAR
jgi:membrane dipeptidase